MNRSLMLSSPTKSIRVQVQCKFHDKGFANCLLAGNVARMNDMIHEEERRHLNNLMIEADLWAKHSLQHTGKVEPALFMHGPQGKAMFGPVDMSTEREKDIFVAMARLVCIAHGADATVLVSEAWTRMAKPGQKLDVTKMPSQCADRQEIVMMMGQTRNSCQQRMLPMERDRNGRFIGFGEEHKINADRLGGRFANLMPAEYPSPHSRALAADALAKMGVVIRTKEERKEERRGMAREM